jgi:predicted DNA-binding transcriptional regulator YafY
VTGLALDFQPDREHCCYDFARRLRFRASPSDVIVSRTSRLFMLLDALRAHRRPVTATRLAQLLSVSLRTIYRDIGTLVELGAPIDGEAGIGYILRTGFFLPPLMFTEDELEALVLGARWVERQGDASLARAAGTSLAKIASASPKDLRDGLAEAGLWAPLLGKPNSPELPLQPIREAIRREHKLRIAYINEGGESSDRVIWPIALAFMEKARVLAAWCELRNGFRHFRADRIRELTPLRMRYPTRRAVLVKQWQAEHKIRLPERS